MSVVKGKQRESKEFTKELFTGFTVVKVVAVNPTKEELNNLIGKEGHPDDKEILYLGEDKDNNKRLRLAFWLQDIKSKKLYVHSFSITNKERRNKDNTKVQLINSACTTTWAPLVVSESGITTDKVQDNLLPSWFTNFVDKEGNIKGVKKWRKAFMGEEELATILKSWLGRLHFSDPETEVSIDIGKLFKENYKELRSVISLDESGEFTKEGYDSPFVCLLGVKTDEDDPSKKYQQVWGKGFLPASFMKNINNGGENGPKFASDYDKKLWASFKKDVEGEYGFNCYYELMPISSYDEKKDILAGKKTKQEVPAPDSSDY